MIIKLFPFAYPTRLMWTVRNSNTDIETNQVNCNIGELLLVIIVKVIIMWVVVKTGSTHYTHL